MACSFSMLEVFKYNSAFIKDDIEYIRLNINQDPYTALESIFKQHEIHHHLAKLIKEKSSFSDSIDEFITTGRFENNIRKCDHSDLIRIINDSFNSLTM